MNITPHTIACINCIHYAPPSTTNPCFGMCGKCTVDVGKKGNQNEGAVLESSCCELFSLKPSEKELRHGV